ncbi:MAG: TonB-dependent receptor [Bacteroidaceae bacterium]
MKKTRKQEGVSIGYPFIKSLFLSILLSVFCNIQAQQTSEILIRGNITDINSEPLIGAAVVLKNDSTVGVITDIDGNYTIKVPNRYAVLEYRYLGFVSQQQEVGNRQVINVILQEDVGQLEEVVVVGYGQQKKESVVGAIATVAPSKLMTGTSRSVSNELAGKLSGVIAVQRSGEPGYDNSSFWIRGISTFQGNRNPLILVDGIERSLNDIDPEEIESFSILKDASASAVYGVRGANGVILIQTKRGEIGKPKVIAKIEQSFTKPTKLPKFVGAAEYLSVLNSIELEADRVPKYSDEFIENIRNRVDPDLYPDVNWMNQVLQDFGDNTRATLDVSGGSEILRYSFVAAYYREGGILERDRSHGWNSSLRLSRYNVRSNVDLNLSPTTLMRFNIGGYMQERISPPQSIDGVFGDAFQTPPHVHPPRYSTGEIPRVSGRPNVWSNLTQTGYERNNRNKIETLFSLEQDLKMLVPGLKVKGTFSFDSYSDNRVTRSKNPDYYNPAIGRDPETGELNLIIDSYGQMFLDHSTGAGFGNRSTYLEGSITYDQTIASDHTVNALFMYNQRNYDDGSALPFRYQGIAGRTSYMYKHRYVGEFNFGYNGSENFAKGNRFGFFPSFAAGWIVSEEKFMENINHVLTKLKLRGSWGLVGNDDVGVRFPYISTIDGTGEYYWGYDRNQFHRAGRREGNVANKNLKWETVAKTNLGLEIGLWNAVDFQVEIFKERRRDIFMRRTTMPASAGFILLPYANFGKVDNKGVEMSLNINKQLTKDFFISGIGTFTYASNKIIEQDEAQGVIGTNRQRTGHSVGQHFGLIDDGLFTEDDFIDVEKGILKEGIPQHTFSPVRPGDIKYVDVNNDGKIDALDYSPIGGTWDPKIVYGFGANMNYKDWDFAFFFQGNGKTDRIIGRSAYFLPGSGMGALGNMYENVDSRWTVDNPQQNVFYPRLTAGQNENNQQSSTWWLKDMSMLRLKSIEVGYNIPKNAVRKMRLNGFRFYVRGTNLLTFSKFKLWDPEIDSTEGSRYPLVKSLSVGLSVNF